MQTNALSEIPGERLAPSQRPVSEYVRLRNIGIQSAFVHTLLILNDPSPATKGAHNSSPASRYLILHRR